MSELMMGRMIGGERKEGRNVAQSVADRATLSTSTPCTLGSIHPSSFLLLPISICLHKMREVQPTNIQDAGHAKPLPEKTLDYDTDLNNT